MAMAEMPLFIWSNSDEADAIEIPDRTPQAAGGIVLWSDRDPERHITDSPLEYAQPILANFNTIAGINTLLKKSQTNAEREKIWDKRFKVRLSLSEPGKCHPIYSGVQAWFLGRKNN